MDEPEFKEKVDDSPELKVKNSDPDAQASPSYENISIEKPEDLIGKVVGSHYKILSVLGEGGMSTVYRAHHMLLNRDVALKFVSNQLIRDSKTVMRLQREAQAAVALNHENICAVKEFGVDESGRPFIVMDLIEGRTLSDKINDSKPLHWKEALSLIRQISAGLSHAHDKGVIHRDIKPSNIILVNESSEKVSIVDFGIAKLNRDDDSGPNLTQTGEIFGTPNYMSPEQCQGESIDHRSDLYSLGCVLYELLSGSPPFKGNMLNIMMEHINEAPEKIHGVPGDVMHIINKCMEKDPKQRYDSALDLQKDIDLVLSGQKLNRARRIRIGKRKELVIRILIISVGVIVLSMTMFKNFWIATDRDLYLNTSQTGKLHTQAEKEHSEGNTEKAFKLLTKAEQLAKSDNISDRSKMTLYRDLAGCSLALNKQEEAIRAFGEAARLAKVIGERNLYEEYLTDQAQSELSFGQNKTAEGPTKEDESLKEKKEQLNALAIKHLEEALASKENRSGKSTRYVIPYWQELGKAYFASGKLNEAEKCFNTVIDIETSQPGTNNPARAISNWYLGLINERKNNLEKAGDYLKKAEKYARLSMLNKAEFKDLTEDLSRVKQKIDSTRK